MGGTLARSKKRARRHSSPIKKPTAPTIKEANENLLADSAEFFAVATSQVPHDLRPLLNIDESSFRLVAGFSHEDARAFYLYAVLDEVQKVSVAIRQWSEFLGDQESRKNFDTTSHLNRTILESVLDEQDFRRRRLLEVLIDLICFRATNEQGYYRHLMLLEDLRHDLSGDIDFRDFYGISNRRIQGQPQYILAWIRNLEQSSIDVTKCWYRKNRAQLEAQPNPGRLLSSVRSRLQTALTEASAHEKLVLGLSYFAYSKASSGVHFQTAGQRLHIRLEEAEKGISMIGVLALNCLVSVQKLLSLTPEGLGRQIWEVLESDEITTMYQTLIGARASVGDFVLAYEQHLAEVLETRTNRFGYETYRVQFLEDSPPLEIAEDWLPPQEIRRLYELDHIATTVKSDLLASGFPPERITDESLRSAIRQAVIDTRKLVLRDRILNRDRDPE